MDAKPDAKTEANPAVNPNEAGTYIIENGVRRLLEPVTADHPEGNRARPEEEALPGTDGAQTPLAKALKARTTTKGGEQ